MFRFAIAALAALFVTTAQAAEPDCNVHGIGYVTQGGRTVYNFAKLAFAPQSDVKNLLLYSSNPPTALADIIDLWRAMGCAAKRRPVPDQVALNLQDHWASNIHVNLDGFNASVGYKYYVNVALHVRDHLREQTLSPAERQLLADTAAWAKKTGNPRFAKTLEGLTQLLNLPPPQ